MRGRASFVVIYVVALVLKNAGVAGSSSWEAKGLDKIFSFLREARAELKRVTWPNKKQVWVSTLLVIVVTLLVSAYLGILDLIFTAVFSKIVG